MERGRVVHRAFIRCRERRVSMELATLMVSIRQSEEREYFDIARTSGAS